MPKPIVRGPIGHDPIAQASPRGDNVPLAVGTIIGTVLALSLGDALIKSLGGGGTLGLWQLFAVRSLLVLPVLAAGAVLLFPRANLLPRSIGWIALRSVLLTAMWVAYYASLPHLPLAVAAAAYYTLPLFIVAFAALFGGEVVGRSQWVAVALGLFGIVLVLRPGGEAFSATALLPLLAAILYAGAMVLTRTKCRTEHPATLAIGLNATFVIAGALGLAFGVLLGSTGAAAPGDTGKPVGFLATRWVSMGPTEWRSVAILAVLILIASVGTAVAYQNAPASTVGTFDFAYVGFALVWGIVFFAERPDKIALAGIALIVAAGVLAVRGRR